MPDDNETKLREAMKKQEAKRLAQLQAELAKMQKKKKWWQPKPKSGG
jgi:hypothetical protein